MKNVVHFQFTKFAEMNETGVVLKESYGYQLYDEYGRYSKDGMTFEQMNEYTVQYVLELMEEEYSEFYVSILDGGYYWNKEWVPVDESGEVLEGK